MTVALGLDAATDGYGVALVAPTGVLGCRLGAAALRASAGLVPLVAEVLREAHVMWDAVGLIAVVDGPGSYTGLRVGLSTAKGLAMARGLPVVGVDAVEAMALAHGRFAGVAEAAVPAGRGRVYAARVAWAGERPRVVEPPQVVDSAAWRAETAGSGALDLGVAKADPVSVARLGMLLAAQGGAVAAERLTPRYASEPRLGPAPKTAGRRG
jgi:tRNA threonylcarbamoyl adenosine modification protein YeaZ